MTFANAVNGSNLDFQNTSGTMEWATRDRYVYGRAENLGIALSAGTFTVQGADGTALSATNPAYVTLSSKTAGQLKRIKVTANQTFIDDSGASTIIGNLFGLTTGIAYTVDLPFFIYAVLNDAENAISFMISRYPNTQTSPASANIGKTGSAVADTQGSFFALDNPTVTDYDANPCVCIGSIRMRMSASDDWTVQALAITDGIGQFQENTIFSMSSGQFGAASGKFFKDNGGTAPSFSTNNIGWTVGRDNRYIFLYDAGNATAGVGAVVAKFAVPYIGSLGQGGAYIFNGGTWFTGVGRGDPGFSNSIMFFLTDPAASINLLNNQITTAAGYTMDFQINPFIQFA